ncbi:MAG: ATP-binding cassette domain-containing protein [Anaerolineales bacterium]
MSVPTPVIRVNGISKHFKVPTREAGLKASIRSVFRRTYRTVKAVDDISFTIEPGEVVGFLGPNGAGKTTTLKVLSGLLYLTAGNAQVLGYVPSRRSADFLQQVTLVMGNRSQLNWDLPVVDSYELQRAIYHLPRAEFERTRDEFIELLDLKDLVNKPVRNLSLGERMKVEIVGALLHRPRVLFLDEPTIGLDLTMQRRIRDFITDYNQRYGATVLLTSHYMADVEALCKRVIIIHNGKLLFDGQLSHLMERFSAFKTICVTFDTNCNRWSQYGEVLKSDGTHASLRIPKAETAEVTARILSEQKVNDLTIEDPAIEDVIEKVFSQENTQREMA